MYDNRDQRLAGDMRLKFADEFDQEEVALRTYVFKLLTHVLQHDTCMCGSECVYKAIATQYITYDMQLQIAIHLLLHSFEKGAFGKHIES